MLLALLAFPAAAQLPDSTRKQISAVFAEYDHTNTPGCALAIYHDGEMAFERGYGMANLELGIAISPRTIFDIGSTSKQFTAFAIGLLAQDGLLTLDDPIRKYLPEMGGYADRITIRNLVQHTSGLRDYLTLMWLAGYGFDDVTDDQDALKLITRQNAPNFAPNSEWLYSNTGYFLLSQIVKRVSGKTLREFAAERVFGPLGMHYTHFHDDHRMLIPDRATGYSPRPEGGYAIEMSGFEQTGDGAVNTSVEELLLWDRNWYSGKVGGRELLARQQETGKLNNEQDHGYAGGLRIGKYRGLPTVRHGGAWAGYRAELLRFPNQKWSVACLCNRSDANPSDLADQVADVILAHQLEAKPAATTASGTDMVLTPGMLAALSGTWRSATTGDLRILEGREGRLYPLGGGSPIKPISADRFSWGPYTMIFASTPKPALKLERDGRVQDTYERVAPVPTDTTGLRRYAGTWYSRELDAVWRLVPDSTGLRIEVRDRASGSVRPVGLDLFSDGQRHLAFTRTSGKVTGFTVAAGRVRGIEFVRRDM
jgi:CubicO group peptidase (beta-lactamase class C family)